MIHKAIILAAGLGTRMRRSELDHPLSDDQASVAADGIKALIPIGRPFLDYSLSALADAGIQSVCLVIGPQHDQVRDYYSTIQCSRINVKFVVQKHPLGTADALAWAAEFAGHDGFLVLNGDNYYPTEALRMAAESKGPATIGFDKDGLIANSNIPSQRVAAYALIEQDEQGYLKNIIEKPSDETWEHAAKKVKSTYRISMNCWRMEPAIFESCRLIKPSSRGELEITDAVMHSIEHFGQPYRVIESDRGVLDLSRQEDIAAVTRWLDGVEVSL